MSDGTEVFGERLDAIIARHQSQPGPGGGVTGFCAECDYVWPCPTLHIASGWSDFDDCFDSGYCEHAGVKF